MKLRSISGTRQSPRNSAQEGRQTIILGTGPLGRQVIGAIRDYAEEEYELIGAIAEPEQDPGEDGLGCKILGRTGNLEAILSTYRPDCIIVAVVGGKMEIMERLLLFLLHSNVSVLSAVEVYETLTGQVPIDTLTPDHFVFGHEVRPRMSAIGVNRVISVLLAGVGAIVSAPVMALIAVAVRLDSEGPAIFVQDRAGLNGRRFGLYKFRTMRLDAVERSVWAAENADRITRVGEWLRKFRLDELPQLFNVLKGDMNLVGPRPHPSPSSELVELISRNVAECGLAMPYYTMRSMVRPGITGWAQVRYKYANGLGEEIEKLRFDLYYVKHYSVWLDLRILMMTVSVVAGGSGNGRVHEKEMAKRGDTVDKSATLVYLKNTPDQSGMNARAEEKTTQQSARLAAERERHSGAVQ